MRNDDIAVLAIQIDSGDIDFARSELECPAKVITRGFRLKLIAAHVPGLVAAPIDPYDFAPVILNADEPDLRIRGGILDQRLEDFLDTTLSALTK